MGSYTHDDMVDLEQWTVDARAARTNPAIRFEEPEVSPKPKNVFEIYFRGTMGGKAGSGIGGSFDRKLRAYLAGYNQLTRFNRRQWLRLFPAWTAQEKREQLEVLADAGGFWII